MRKIVANRLDGSKAEYIVPSTTAAKAHIKATFERQWDKIERRHVEGGLPLVWDRVQ